jgi:NADH:ubiquinone oxidoreductase subunit 6 (subunit J)
MALFNTIRFILTFFLVLSACSIFLMNNPVHSVLFLILNFCLASLIILIYEVEFLGLLFVMVLRRSCCSFIFVCSYDS